MPKLGKGMKAIMAEKEAREADDVPFVAFGNAELEKARALAKGDKIVCALCNGAHDVSLGTDEHGNESPMLQFISCGDDSYLVGVNGKSVMKADGPFRAQSS